jgi:thiol-disulfide isomerase/thioredoxin
MKRNLMYGGIVILFISLGFYFGFKQFGVRPADRTASDSLFSHTFTDTDGRSQSLSQWRGKPLIINFWATWCAPCVEEMPELSALQAEIAPQNIHIIGIGVDSASNILQFSSKYKINYPLYTASMNGIDLSRQFGNRTGGLPFTVLLGSDGQIKKTYLGRLQIADLRKDLASL